MRRQNPSTIRGAVGRAMPDNRFLKLNEQQIASFKKTSDVALAMIGTVGAIAVAAVAPNLFHIISNLTAGRKSNRKFSREQKIRKVEDTFYYLKRSGLVRFAPTGKEIMLSLTDKGRKKYSLLEFDTIRIPHPKIWNSHWWLVAADIPTREHRAGADMLRRKLKALGFYPLQRTLWLHPFDPRKEIEFISQTYDVAKFVTLMEIARLDREDEKTLKGHFQKGGIL